MNLHWYFLQDFGQEDFAQKDFGQVEMKSLRMTLLTNYLNLTRRLCDVLELFHRQIRQEPSLWLFSYPEKKIDFVLPE